MTAEIITIGDELLIGQVVDTNSSWMAQQLNMIGIPVSRRIAVGDSIPEILNAMNESVKRADVILITGGLGPTSDDVTKKALCEFFKKELVFHEAAFDNVKKIFERRKLRMPEMNRKQAEVPENATVMENTRGTAPGLWFDENGKTIVSMPGVPFEMYTMMELSVLPQLKKKFPSQTIFHKTFLTSGIGESALAEKISEWESNLETTLKLAYLPSPGIVKLRLSGRGKDATALKKCIDSQLKKLEQIVPDFFFGYDDDSLQSVIGEMLKSNKLSVCTAESCTGGSVAKLFTSVPGSSEYFKGSVVAYSYEAKKEILSVKAATIENQGAVSQATVLEMAQGALKLFNADCAIAISGIAGPSGEVPGKPVGTVWIAVSTPERTLSEMFLFGKNRQINIQLSAYSALNLLRKLLKES